MLTVSTLTSKAPSPSPRTVTPGKGGRAQAGEASGAAEDCGGGQVSVVFVKDSDNNEECGWG